MTKGKFGQRTNTYRFVKWFLTIRLWCPHNRGVFKKRVGRYSQYHCSDCDGDYKSLDYFPWET